MKQLFFLLLIPFLGFSQVQIGQDINGSGTNDSFGRYTSISSDGSIIVISAVLNDDNGVNSGQVKVYENIAGTWIQIGADLNGEAESDFFGSRVSLSGNGSILAIGANRNDSNGADAGKVKVYENISGTWTQIGSDIIGEAAGDYLGFSLSLSDDGTILAIGATRNDDGGSNSGHTKVYKNLSGTWTQIGSSINGEAQSDQSGYNVNLSNDGSILAIGANGSDDACNNCGHVRVYENIANTWTQIGSDIDGVEENEFVGIHLSLSGDGNNVAIGAYFNDTNGVDSGQVRVYKNIANTWTQTGLSINGDLAGDRFGNGVSLSDDGTILAVGARTNDANGIDSGLVRVFKNTSNTWTQIGTDINGDDIEDYLGYVNVSSDGLTLLTGGSGDDGNSVDSGLVRMYDISSFTLSTDSFNTDKFNIYPNPTSNVLNLELTKPSEFKNVYIHNNLGQLILKDNKTKIDVSNYSKGIYFAEIETTKGKTTKKFIVE